MTLKRNCAIHVSGGKRGVPQLGLEREDSSAGFMDFAWILCSWTAKVGRLLVCVVGRGICMPKQLQRLYRATFAAKNDLQLPETRYHGVRSRRTMDKLHHYQASQFKINASANTQLPAVSDKNQRKPRSSGQWSATSLLRLKTTNHRLPFNKFVKRTFHILLPDGNWRHPVLFIVVFVLFLVLAGCC